MDEKALRQLLRATFRYILIKELKSIPFAIIRRLPKVPREYLEQLTDPNLPDLLNVRSCVFCVRCDQQDED